MNDQIINYNLVPRAATLSATWQHYTCVFTESKSYWFVELAFFTEISPIISCENDIFSFIWEEEVGPALLASRDISPLHDKLRSRLSGSAWKFGYNCT